MRSLERANQSDVNVPVIVSTGAPNNFRFLLCFFEIGTDYFVRHFYVWKIDNFLTTNITYSPKTENDYKTLNL